CRPGRLRAGARLAFLVGLVAWTYAPAGFALEPDEVLLLARAADPEAGRIVAHYCARRGVPRSNVFGLHVAPGETISRRDFERWVLAPLRRELRRPERARIRCLLVLRGLPLRVGPADMEEASPPSGPGAELHGRRSTIAAFDSEIATVLRPPASLEGWARNPLYRPFPVLPVAAPVRGPDRPLMVARLDAPTRRQVIGLIDRAVEGQRLGLDGLFCFDARGLRGKGGYAAFDTRIREAARLAERSGLPVLLDDTPRLFGKGDCEGTAFYVGWYSLNRYRPAFTFVPGAIGYHVASAEAHTLHRGGSGRPWVRGLIEDGITASWGPTNEPYLGSFPDPVAVLARVIEGRHTLAELYWETIPHVSWRQVLVGDPLYRPHLAARFERARPAAGGR
ncbi:MAG: TIGR03790 family protein, partial [Planctomycetota bacterium]